MKRTISLKEARLRSKLPLVSDKDLPYFDSRIGFNSVRDGQKRMESRYINHRLLRECATKHFFEKGLEVYPRGIAVDGSGTCLDFAFFKKNQIIFVECLTAHWVRKSNTMKKCKVEDHAPLIFIVEDPTIVEFSKAYGKRNYQSRLKRLALNSKVFLCNHKSGEIKKYKHA